VLGTDISATALARARHGTYRTRSMRLVSAEHRDRWFEAPDHNEVRVGEQLRALVRFERHNLVRDPSPPAGEALFDVVVCRNVLIYFERDTVLRTVRALREALTPHGTLVLGTADRLGTHGGPPDPQPPAPRRADPPRRRPAVVRTASPARAPARRPGPPPADGPADPAPESSVAVTAFEAGVEALTRGDAEVAVAELRRAVYLDPGFAVAALQLGRAHEEAGDVAAARRAYWRALRLAETAERPMSRLYDRVGAGDVAAACRARLSSLPEN